MHGLLQCLICKSNDSRMQTFMHVIMLTAVHVRQGLTEVNMDTRTDKQQNA